MVLLTYEIVLHFCDMVLLACDVKLHTFEMSQQQSQMYLDSFSLYPEYLKTVHPRVEGRRVWKAWGRVGGRVEYNLVGVGFWGRWI